MPFKTALERILKAVKDAGKFTIIYCANFNIANARLKHGFDSVTVGQKQKRQRFHKIKYIEQKQQENCKKKVLKKPDFTVFL